MDINLDIRSIFIKYKKEKITINNNLIRRKRDGKIF